MVLEKTLESPLDCKEIQPVHSEGVGNGQGGLTCCDSWGRKESDTTARLNLTEFTVSHRFWVVVFSFSFISRHILISFLISSVIYSVVIQQLVVQPPYVGIFNSFSPVIVI